jgi:hypothetical protein
LETRTGTALAERMSDQQLIDFEQFVKTNDESGALEWLEDNFPDYRDVVTAEFEKLKLEIKQLAPQIVASADSQSSEDEGLSSSGTKSIL